MTQMTYKIIEIPEYVSQLETTLNELGSDGWRLVDIYNTQAMFVSGAAGINVTGSVILPSGVVSSSTQVFNTLNNGQWVGLYIQSGSGSRTTGTGPLDAAHPFLLDSESFAKGFSLIDKSKIIAHQSGIYKFSLSANALQAYGNQYCDFIYDIWIRKNGMNVEFSAKRYFLKSDDSLSADGGRASQNTTYDICTDLQSGSHIEFVWNSRPYKGGGEYAGEGQVFLFGATTGSGGTYSVNSRTNPTRPLMPSVSINVIQVG